LHIRNRAPPRPEPRSPLHRRRLPFAPLSPPLVALCWKQGYGLPILPARHHVTRQEHPMSTDSRTPRAPRTSAFVQALGIAFALVATTAMLGGTELLATQRTVSSYAQVLQLPRVTVTKQRIAGVPALHTAADERQSAPGG